MMVVDIECPSCERANTLQKRGIGRYYCTECENEFSRQDLRSP